jgi:hypothetical protein
VIRKIQMPEFIHNHRLTAMPFRGVGGQVIKIGVLAYRKHMCVEGLIEDIGWVINIINERNFKSLMIISSG